jgi:hypothetical protein
MVASALTPEMVSTGPGRAAPPKRGQARGRRGRAGRYCAVIAGLIPRTIGGPLNGFLALPEVLSALRSLPEIAANTAAMAQATRTLPEINERLAEVAAGASMLPEIDRRMQTIEAAMPTLVEVQQHLRELPAVMAELEAALAPLIEAADTLGRVARRLPRRRPAP